MAILRWKLLARIVSVLIVPVSLWTLSKWLLGVTEMTVWWLVLLGITLVLLVLEAWTFIDIAGLKKDVAALRSGEITLPAAGPDPVDKGEERRELKMRLKELPRNCRQLLLDMRAESRRTVTLHESAHVAEVLGENDVFEYVTYEEPWSTWKITDKFWAILQKKSDWEEVLGDVA